LKRLRLARHVAGDDLKSVVWAALIGAPLPLCSCSVVPVAIALRRAGASKGATTAFATSTPEVGIDSVEATNPEAAARALASFDRIYWIAGGRPKEGGLDAVLPWLDRVRHAYLIGEAAGPFAEWLAPHVSCSQCGDLATAFDQARAAAQRDAGEDPVVLLTPACASFDQFSNFEARGDAFRALVAGLAEQPARAAGGARR
jgi:hypothetical protein